MGISWHKISASVIKMIPSLYMTRLVLCVTVLCQSRSVCDSMTPINWDFHYHSCVVESLSFRAGGIVSLHGGVPIESSHAVVRPNNLIVEKEPSRSMSKLPCFHHSPIWRRYRLYGRWNAWRERSACSNIHQYKRKDCVASVAILSLGNKYRLPLDHATRHSARAMDKDLWQTQSSAGYCLRNDFGTRMRKS